MQQLINSAVEANWLAPASALEPLSGASMPLRITMAASRYLPFCGGTETHVHEVSCRLARAGHQVTVVTANPGGLLPAREERDGVLIRRVRAWPRQRDYYFAPAIFGAISPETSDIVHVQGYHTLFAPAAMMAAIARRIPFVITFHSGGHSSAIRSRMRPLQMSLLRPLATRAARCIGVSRFEADLFADGMGLDRSRFTVIPNGAELPRPNAVESKPGAGPLILSIGRLERYKGHHRAIAAMPHLLRKMPDARLQILGGGPYESALRRQADELGLSDRVAVGFIPGGDRQALSNLMARADLVVLLSDYEANPVAVMETLSLGRPMLATDSSGFKELHERGLLNVVPLDADAPAIAAAMADELRRGAGTRPVFELPGWQHCADSLLAVYREVLQHRGPFQPEVAH